MEVILKQDVSGVGYKNDIVKVKAGFGNNYLIPNGFALIANALASLVVPYQIPAVLVISERGAMGEFNIGQVLIARTMRPALDSLGILNHTLTDAATLSFIVNSSIKQAFTTQTPVALILSPLLTGGNPASYAQLI